jgi:hypothetical protein
MAILIPGSLSSIHWKCFFNELWMEEMNKEVILYESVKLCSKLPFMIIQFCNLLH